MVPDTVTEIAADVNMKTMPQDADSKDKQKWGFELFQLYQLAVKFYKGDVSTICSLFSFII